MNEWHPLPHTHSIMVHTLAHLFSESPLPSFTPSSIAIFLLAALLDQGCDFSKGGEGWVFCLNNSWLFCGTSQFVNSFNKYELLATVLKANKVNLGIRAMGVSVLMYITLGLSCPYPPS